jgi:hypothetical protein
MGTIKTNVLADGRLQSAVILGVFLVLPLSVKLRRKKRNQDQNNGISGFSNTGMDSSLFWIFVIGIPIHQEVGTAKESTSCAKKDRRNEKIMLHLQADHSGPRLLHLL